MSDVGCNGAIGAFYLVQGVDADNGVITRARGSSVGVSARGSMIMGDRESQEGCGYADANAGANVWAYSFTDASSAYRPPPAGRGFVGG